jgi:hypothetical protein
MDDKVKINNGGGFSPLISRVRFPGAPQHGAEAQ